MSKNVRKPSPPQSAAQRQRDLARMLVRMDEMLKATAELAVKARSRVAVGGLTRYRRFAKRVRDFFALAAVAEEKLYNMPELAESPMALAHDRMHARMVVLFVEGSWGFFDLYRRVPELPLGANEICGVELRGLGEIRKFLDDERYDGERGQALRRQAERVTDLMHEVMDRVAPLEDFGDLPSISPKGVRRQPIKAPPKRRADPPPPEPAPEPAPEAAQEATWSVMSFADPPPQGAPYQDQPQPYEAAGGAWPNAASYGDSEPVEAEYDDSAYLDDAPDDPEPEPPPAARPSPAHQPPSPPAARQPSPLVRELTLDMVEAEERRAAMAERLAASGRPAGPAASPAAASPAAAPPAPAQRAAAPFAAPRPAASPPRPAAPRPAAPFRAPPPRPPKGS